MYHLGWNRVLVPSQRMQASTVRFLWSLRTFKSSRRLRWSRAPLVTARKSRVTDNTGHFSRRGLPNVTSRSFILTPKRVSKKNAVRNLMLERRDYGATIGVCALCRVSVFAQHLFVCVLCGVVFRQGMCEGMVVACYVVTKTCLRMSSSLLPQSPANPSHPYFFCATRAWRVSPEQPCLQLRCPTRPTWRFWSTALDSSSSA